MKNAMRLGGVVLVLIVLVNWASARADEPAAKGGSVTGTVMKDGKPVANACVGLIAAPVKAKGKGLTKHAATQPAAADGQSKHGKHEIVGNTTTNSDGKFTLENIPAGEYVVVAGEKGQGRGKVRVTVSEGESASVSIDLQAPKEKVKKPNKLGL